MCANSLQNKDTRDRLILISYYILSESLLYEAKAITGALNTLKAFLDNESSIVYGSVSKKELNDLYVNALVNNKKPREEVYDELINRVPNKKCPYCEIGQVTTLDHYLPKSKFPLFSVTPINLIPSCKDCNTAKSSKLILSPKDQSLHPYFDHGHFISEQWLTAEVIYENKTIVNFYVSPPAHWSNIDKGRVNAHFKSFNLAERYSNEASNELASLKSIFEATNTTTSEGRRILLERSAISLACLNPKTSWRIAMHHALSKCEYYCSSGFNLIN